MTSATEKMFSPLLALSETMEDLNAYKVHLPLYGSFKLDGIRGLDLPRGAKEQYMASRSLKPLPSKYAQDLALQEYVFFDGELLVKPSPLAEGETIMGATFSAVMTHDATTPLDWWIFDFADKHSDCTVKDLPYTERIQIVREMLYKRPHQDIKILEQRPLYTVEDIAAMEKEALDLEYEGLIVRRMDGLYKCGRSSFKQGWLMKIVRTFTSEAEVLDIEEMMHNDNEATKDARGYTVRSKHQANMRATGMLGAYICRDLKTNVVFRCGNGPGITHQFREEAFRLWPKDKGRIFKYSHKPYGTKELPRQPKWLVWRNLMDIS